MRSNSEIYIHVPFCVRKCAYCDFTSFVAAEETRDRYFDMLEKEIVMTTESLGKTPIDSVFIGGGTPSIAGQDKILHTFEVLRKNFDIRDGAEITIEANPNSITKDKLQEYLEAGINRISIGLQSTSDEELKTLSRVHTFDEFLRAYELVRNTGFTNVNIDIMSAIPGQSVKSYEKTLKRVTDLNPEHISAYSLIIEENTPFYERYSSGKGLPTEEEDREMYHLTKLFLKEKGYERYEISNYSKPGFACRHNVGYWTRKNYYGFGLSAASLIDDVRYQNHRDIKRYLEGDFSKEEEKLDKNDCISEFMFLGLRLCRGVSLKAFEDVFGLAAKVLFKSQIDKLKKQGLIEVDDYIRLTDLGMDVANYCMSEFIL